MADMTYGDLDDMVELSPLDMRDAVWAELQRLHAELDRRANEITELGNKVVDQARELHVLRSVERNAQRLAQDPSHPAYAEAANWILTGGGS